MSDAIAAQTAPDRVPSEVGIDVGKCWPAPHLAPALRRRPRHARQDLPRRHQGPRPPRAHGELGVHRDAARDSGRAAGSGARAVPPCRQVPAHGVHRASRQGSRQEPARRYRAASLRQRAEGLRSIPGVGPAIAANPLAAVAELGGMSLSLDERCIWPPFSRSALTPTLANFY